MNFQTYHCSAGKAVPKNPYQENNISDRFSIVNTGSIDKYAEFQIWAQSQPLLSCDESLSGEYPVSHAEEIENQWFDESIGQWRQLLGNDDFERAVYYLHKTRKYISFKSERPNLKQPLLKREQKEPEISSDEIIRQLEKENILFRQVLAKISTYAANALKPKGDDTINDIIDTVRPGINPNIKVR